MKTIMIEKVTLNVGAGESGAALDKGVLLLNMITGEKPVKTASRKRIPTWKIRPGLPIGCKVTLRRKKAVEMLKVLLKAVKNNLSSKQFDAEGNFSFGIREYLDIPGVDYNPEVGIIGLEVAVTLQRPGFRIKRRSIKRKRIPAGHRITREEAMEFVKKQFNVKIE